MNNISKAFIKTKFVNKSISIFLICSLLLVCLSGCSIFKVNNTVLGGEDKTDYFAMKFDEFFDVLKSDANNNRKLSFDIEYEEIHYELKNSELYNNSMWTDPGYIVNVCCDYNCAVNEVWYKKCSGTDIKSLNSAFYNYYSLNFQNGEYSNIIFAPGMHLLYFSPTSSIQADYAAIKALTGLEYVTNVSICYYYSVPYDWMQE